MPCRIVSAVSSPRTHNMKNHVSILMMLQMMHPSANDCFAAELLRNAPRCQLSSLVRNTRSVTEIRNGHIPTHTCLFEGKLLNIAERCSNSETMIPCHVFDLRGGDNRALEKHRTHEDEDKDIIIDQELIGIADLRQHPEADCIVLAQVHDQNPSAKVGNDRKKSPSAFLDAAMFPSVASDTTDSSSHGDVDQQAAAASLTIGSSCSTIYLVVSYDFKHGKTILHRTLGGTKLISLVDGVRKRWHETSNSQPASTKLVLLLVPYISANNGPIEEFMTIPAEIFDDLSQPSEWKHDGARFLVERLRTYFELGGEDYRGAQPFSNLDIIRVRDKRMQAPPPSGQNQDKHYDPNIRLDIVLRHIQQNATHRTNSDVVNCLSAQEFRPHIQRKFEFFGGIGVPTFGLSPQGNDLS